MSDFEKYWDNNVFGDDKHRVSNVCIAENAFNTAKRLQQAKNDELQKQLALVLDAYYLTDYFDANVCISAENALGDENRLSDSWYLKNVKGEPNDH